MRVISNLTHISYRFYGRPILEAPDPAIWKPQDVGTSSLRYSGDAIPIIPGNNLGISFQDIDKRLTTAQVYPFPVIASPFRRGTVTQSCLRKHLYNPHYLRSACDW